MVLPPRTMTLAPKLLSKPAWLPGFVGAPFARTYLASTMPQLLFVATLQMSTAFTPWMGSLSSSARPSSQNLATSSTAPLQSSSDGTAIGLFGSVRTSTAPGPTFGSQSLQSPWFSVVPSPSSSTSALVTQTMLPPAEPPVPGGGKMMSPPSPPELLLPDPLPPAPDDVSSQAGSLKTSQSPLPRRPTGLHAICAATTLTRPAKPKRTRFLRIIVLRPRQLLRDKQSGLSFSRRTHVADT